MEIVLLGDQLAECQQLLKQVITIKDNIILGSLLDRVASALLQEISLDPHRACIKQISRFSTTKELIEWYYSKGQPNTALESAFLCLAQLTHFVCYLEERHESYLQGHSKIFGACTGLLAASAIASANSLTTLLPLAVEAVRIAFRTGIYVGEVADRLEGCHNAGQSWSTIVTTSDKNGAEAAIGEYNKAHAFALSNKLWISVYAPSSVTISGPPSKRNRLLRESDFYSKAKQRDIKIHAPYHASHLHSSSEAKKILDDQTRQVFENTNAHFPIFSSVTAQPIAVSSPIKLLEVCLDGILRDPLHWDLLVKECTSGSLIPQSDKCHIRAFGPTELAGNLFSTIKTTKSGIEVSMEDHNSWLASHRGNVSSTRQHLSSDIAIVGMSGRFPDAADHEKFWELLEKGLDVHREVPPGRYPVKSHTDPTSKKRNTSHTPYGNFIESPGLFDARFFNMSPREANQTDPMQRLSLVTAYEAMEMAGIVPGRTDSTKADRIGTFYGMTSDDWREINAAQNIDTYFISGGVRAFGPGRINYYMKFSGPSFVVDTACSSSFAALQLACTSLRAGECDTAFSGGANVLTNPDIFSGLSRGHFLSPTGNCKTFDNDADGYCRGDGVATVILKRMEHALRDKDPILGVIKGTATNHSAEAVSITHPHVGAQQFLFDKVLRDSNIDCRDVSYVEMHGTGTQAGDAVEMESVSSVFAPSQPRRTREQPLWLGSVKANIGHGESASGVCSLIKVLLMLQKNTIPPHCGIKGIMNKKFQWKDLQARGVNIAFEKTPFPRPAGGKRTVFLNNFSAAGGNTGVLLEDAPEKTAIASLDPRPVHVVNVSAKSLSSFKKNIKLLRAFINKNSNLDLASLAYTSTARRMHYSYRASFAVSNINELSNKLAPQENEGASPIPPDAPQVAFAFTRQGSLYTNLGKQLFEKSARFRLMIENFDKLAGAQGLPSFMVLLDTDSAHEYLNTLSPVITQVGMVCVQMALVDLWTSWGLKPKTVIGHSLGEYAALYAAGVLSAADTIFLVGARASRMEEQCTKDTHAMLAVKISSSVVQEIISGTNVEIACINSDDETVVAGLLSDIRAVSEKLRVRKVEFKKLNVTYAFHSSQMDPTLKSFQAAANAVTYNVPQIPVLSPLLSSIRKSRRQRSTVFCDNDEKTLWVEIGAHPICTRFIKASLGTSVTVFPSLKRGKDPWKTVATSLSGLYLAGANLSWSAYHQDFESSLECISLPTYSFDNKVHWLQYVNDWTLTKGDPVQSAPAALLAPKFSTSIHQIIQQNVEKDQAIVIAESNIADPLLHKTIAGHSVNGVGLGPSSLWADMALTLTGYAYKQLRPSEKQPDMNVHHMENPA